MQARKKNGTVLSQHSSKCKVCSPKAIKNGAEFNGPEFQPVSIYYFRICARNRPDPDQGQYSAKAKARIRYRRDRYDLGRIYPHDLQLLHPWLEPG